MTKFQDPPLRSRRAVRQSEVHHGETPEVDAPVRPATARTGRRAQLPSATEWNAGIESNDGSPRIVAAPSEPFTFTTQSLPQMSPVAAEARPVAPPVAVDSAAGTSATASDKPKASPGRRVSLAAGEAHIPIAADVQPTQPDDVVRETAMIETPPVEEAIVEVAASVEAPPAETISTVETTDDEPVVQRTMTRRELREIRAAAERAGELQVPEAISAILNSGPIILPYLSSATATIATVVDRETAAEAEFDALTREPTAATSEEDQSVFTSAPVSTWGMTLEPAEATRSVEDDDSDDDLGVQISAPPLAAASAEEPAGDAVPLFIEPTHGPASARAAGHWSVRADMDEDIESLENTITRSVGTGGALTTSALVLPSVPQSSDITSPFTASGEIMSTGSVDLPRSLASTGVHPSRVDTSDFDLDPLDHEVPSTDSAPVRAIRAVSTHTGSNGMVTSKKQSNRTLTVLVISASTMAVGVAGLLIAGYALQIFP